MSVDYPDPDRHPRAHAAHEAAPVETGDTIRVLMAEGCGAWSEEFPLEYEVRRIDPPGGLSALNEYVIRAYHPNPPYMVEGCSDTVLCPQTRRGDQWELIDE